MATTEMLENAAAYAEEHKVFQLFESLLQELVVNKPDKPLDHLIKVLKRDPVPRVIVSGPPGAAARSLCELIAAKAKPNLVHVIASDVWRELAKIKSSAGLKAKGLVDDGKEIPAALMVEMLVEKLTTGECVTKGWVLEGFPGNAAEARSMLAKGLLPTRFLQIGVDDAECVRRVAGRRVDPETNTIYHLQDEPPPDAETAARLIQRATDTKEEVTARLLAYRQSMAGVLPCFSKVLVDLDGSVPGEAGVNALLAAALPTITAEMPTRAPRGCPRVLLIGGPGTSLETLGAQLAATYGVKHVSAIDLLHGASLNGSKAAAKAMATPDPLAMGDNLVGPLVLNRLKADDVRTAGFVLTGFPRTTQNAAFLDKNKVWLRHVVHLALDPKVAETKVTGTRYDPVDGEVYHISDAAPSDDDTAKRMVVHPKDSKPQFKMAMKAWTETKGPLMKRYADKLREEDATRPESALVERLAPCFLSL